MDNFVYFGKKDSYGSDIMHIRDKSPTELANIALDMKDCVAFNSLGYFKFDIAKPKYFTNTSWDIYVKKEWLDHYQNKKDFVTAYIVAGLGNRLFILASTIGIARKQGKEPVIFNEFIKDNPHGSIKEHEYFYKNLEKRTLLHYRDTMLRFIEPLKCSGKYLNIPQVEGNIHLAGFFQTEKYFQEVKDEIKEMFKCPLDREISFRQKYDLNNSVFIHIRRGDYVNHSLHNVNLSKYYPRAINIFPPDVSWIILSDDLEYCKKSDMFNFDKISFIDENDVNSIWVMSLCNGGICANSSFSWWGAYLQSNSIYPRTYPSKNFNDSSYNTVDMIPDCFQKIDVD